MIARPGRFIPVVLGEPGAGVAPSFATCPPITYVNLAADADWTMGGGWPRHNGDVYTALIDTGADTIFVRPEVAAAIGAKLIGNGVIHGLGEPQAGARRARIQIIFPQAEVVYLAKGAAVTPFFGDRRSFDIVLGRQFLEHCQLVVDGPNGAYRLQWIR
jgi:predicted aspartyl protease